MNDKNCSAPRCCSEKTAAVLDAAARVFLAHGFSAATTDMIQRAAAVSKATVYACYPNKEALFAAVIERECQRMMDGIRALDGAGQPLRPALSEMGRAYLSMLLSPNGLALYRVVVADAPRFPELGRLFFQTGPQQVVAIVTRLLCRAADSLDLSTIGAAEAAKLFLSLLRNEAQLELLTHPTAQTSAAGIDRLVELAVGTFLRAYAPGSANG
jgi:AcrR family transcriptional regulator